MLVLSRRTSERIIFGATLLVTVETVLAGVVRLLVESTGPTRVRRGTLESTADFAGPPPIRTFEPATPSFGVWLEPRVRVLLEVQGLTQGAATSEISVLIARVDVSKAAIERASLGLDTPIGRGKVSLGLAAPDGVPIRRYEHYVLLQASNAASGTADGSTVSLVAAALGASAAHARPHHAA